MRKYFFTGLALFLPAVFTILIVGFIIDFLTKPFQEIVNHFLTTTNLQGKTFLFLSGDQVLYFASKILILVTLFILTILIGILGRLVIIRSFLKFGEWIIQRIPIVNKIYIAAKEVVGTLFSSKKTNFSKVVLVPFPHNKTYSVGLVTSEALPPESDKEIQSLVSVFIPATPNPTLGFMLLFKRDEIIFLDTKVDDALKLIISCGVIANGFSPTKKSMLESG